MIMMMIITMTMTITMMMMMMMVHKGTCYCCCSNDVSHESHRFGGCRNLQVAAARAVSRRGSLVVSDRS